MVHYTDITECPKCGREFSHYGGIDTDGQWYPCVRVCSRCGWSNDEQVMKIHAFMPKLFSKTAQSGTRLSFLRRIKKYLEMKIMLVETEGFRELLINWINELRELTERERS